MEIPSILYLCFFATLSVLALIPLRVLLNKVEEFSSRSSELQQILHTFLCFSLSYAFLWHPSLSLFGARDSVRAPPEWCYPYLNLMLFYSFKFMVENSSPDSFLVVVVTLLMLSSFLLTIFITWFRKDSNTLSLDLYHWLAWVIYTGLSGFTSSILRDEDHTIEIKFDNPFLPYVIGPILAYLLLLYQTAFPYPVIEIPLSIKIILGVIGNILANHYLKDKNVPLLSLVASFAIFWLGNIALLQSTCQAGIFGFLVGAIVDIAGEIFGLNIYMWLVGLGCGVLFIFFEHLDEFNLRYPGANYHEMGIEGPSQGPGRTPTQPPTLIGLSN